MESQFLDYPRKRKIGLELTERILKKSLSFLKLQCLTVEWIRNPVVARISFKDLRESKLTI